MTGVANSLAFAPFNRWPVGGAPWIFRYDPLQPHKGRATPRRQGETFCLNSKATPRRLAGLSRREALWSAVAAATAFRLFLIPPSHHSENEKGGSCCDAFRLFFILQSRHSRNEKGGSCCDRTPKRASPAGRVATPDSYAKDPSGCGSPALHYLPVSGIIPHRFLSVHANAARWP